MGWWKSTQERNEEELQLLEDVNDFFTEMEEKTRDLSNRMAAFEIYHTGMIRKAKERAKIRKKD